MAISILASSSASRGGTTTAIDTTGASLIVIGVAQFVGNNNPPDLTDSESNTYTQAVASTNTTSGNGQVGYIYYCSNPTTSATHTFTDSGGTASSFAVVAALGSLTSATPLDQTSDTVYNAPPNITSETPGSVTPSEGGELCVAAYAIDVPAGSTFSVDSGYTIQQEIDVIQNVNFGIVLATLVQTSVAATNPALSRAALTGGDVAMIATFKSASTPPPPTFEPAWAVNSSIAIT